MVQPNYEEDIAPLEIGVVQYKEEDPNIMNMREELF